MTQILCYRTVWIGVFAALLLLAPAGPVGAGPSEEQPVSDFGPEGQPHEAPLGNFTLDPGTLIAFDVPQFTLYKYAPDGTVLDSMGVIDTVGLGNPVGLARIGNDVWISGTSRQVARINLTTAQTEANFLAGALIGLEAMASDGAGNLLLCGYSDDTVHTYDTAGNLLGSTPLQTSVGCTGIDTDGVSLYIADYDSGQILTFDLSGNPTGVIVSGLPIGSLSAVAYDPASGTVWAATGFGSDQVLHYDLGGTLLGSFLAAGPWHNALTLVPQIAVPVLDPWSIGLVLLLLATALTVLTIRLTRRPQGVD